MCMKLVSHPKGSTQIKSVWKHVANLFIKYYCGDNIKKVTWMRHVSYTGEMTNMTIWCRIPGMNVLMLCQKQSQASAPVQRLLQDIYLEQPVTESRPSISPGMPKCI
jgi:hypothetical protein